MSAERLLLLSTILQALVFSNRKGNSLGFNPSLIEITMTSYMYIIEYSGPKNVQF